MGDKVTFHCNSENVRNLQVTVEKKAVKFEIVRDIPIDVPKIFRR